MKSAYKSSTGNRFDMRARHLVNLEREASARAASRDAMRSRILSSYQTASAMRFASNDAVNNVLGNWMLNPPNENILAALSNENRDSSGSGAGSVYGGSSPLTYSDWSPAAKMFGMDKSTAYEEHMANTAHQREVADLKAAGLNPVLGLSSGAPVVSGSYVGGSGYGSSAKKTSFKNIADVIGSIAGMIVLAKSKNKYAGSWTASMTSKAFSQAGKLLDDVLE